jgi:hypothetical protein
MIEVFTERPNIPAGRFSENANDINDRSTIRPPLGQERAG